MPIWNKSSLQNRNSPLIEHLTIFHDHSILIISIITILLVISITILIIQKFFNRILIESNQIELFWTTSPALILIFIAIPSIKTLYLIEENINPLLSIKTIGFQWFWTYEYSNIIKNNTSTITLSNKTRLIRVTNPLIIPTITPTRIIVSSKDVIHSWAIPSLGIKIDATPGRINQTTIITKRPSIMVGQCSEICGAGHRFIPIIIETPNISKFLKNIFLKSTLQRIFKPNKVFWLLEAKFYT